MEASYVRAVFCLTVHLYIGLSCGHRHIRRIHDIDALSCIHHLPIGKKRHGQYHKHRRDQATCREECGKAYFGFYILDDHVSVYLLVIILAIIRDIPDAPLPTVEAADEMPEVEMIHVEILGTVSMVNAPMTNVPMTIPNERIPLLANTVSFSRSAPLVPTNA